MPQIVRELTGDDIDEAFALAIARPLFGPRLKHMASKTAQCDLWRRLLGRLAIRSGVLIDAGLSDSNCMITFGIGGFVCPLWLKAFLNRPFPFVGAHVLEELLAGKDGILLRDEDVREANSSSGLSALVLTAGWRYSRSRTTPPFAAKMGSVAAFQHAYRGFRMNEFVTEAISGPEADFCLSSYSWRERARFSFGAGQSTDQYLLGIARIEAQQPGRETSIVSPLFVWPEVRFCFMPQQQALLLLASSRMSDKDIARKLNIGPDAVGRRFDRIFRRVVMRQHESCPVFPKGTDRFAKRSLLLDYLKDNIHELRPHNFSHKTKQRAVAAVSGGR